MTFKYAVTFESETQPVTTQRGEVSSAGWHTAASRALKSARKALPGKHPTSIVVLLEKQSA